VFNYRYCTHLTLVMVLFFLVQSDLCFNRFSTTLALFTTTAAGAFYFYTTISLDSSLESNLAFEGANVEGFEF